MNSLMAKYDQISNLMLFTTLFSNSLELRTNLTPYILTSLWLAVMFLARFASTGFGSEIMRNFCQEIHLK